MARPASLAVRPPATFTDSVDALRERAGVPAVLVIRRFERGREGKLPRPTDAVFRYPDGREEPVLAIEIQYGDRRLLRDLVLAEGQRLASWLAPYQRTRTAPTTDGLPTQLLCPATVVLSGCEAVFPGALREPHRLPPPP